MAPPISDDTERAWWGFQVSPTVHAWVPANDEHGARTALLKDWQGKPPTLVLTASRWCSRDQITANLLRKSNGS